ncbi:30S ribosomal protein S1 [Pelotomaculum schinkii]|uniref:30S ribosomal protein S1 n=1 Tax=Pelotomaculum schinkii TaxID=78350 RepID=A0A4Y7RGA5_9FIRM|nr:Tex family protein [Pelotomaculum schinkii]TEB07789.1 30S ribosomal protein S1 [Pelotomaculum schinkii]
MIKQVDIIAIVAKETGIPRHKVEQTVKLLADNTIPFIARYRKEQTGELDEEQIRNIDEQHRYYTSLEQRKEEIIRLIDEQGKLTEELQAKIINCTKLSKLEDLYLPYKPKRKTRAGVAREHGLEPLANFLLSFPRSESPEEEAYAYISESVPTVEEALQGAMDIVAESVAEDADVRGWVREHTRRGGLLVTSGRKTEEDKTYRDYYDYKEPVNRIPPHRVLAINRGEKEEVLSVSIEVDESPVLQWLKRKFLEEGSTTSEYVSKAIKDGYKRLIAPAVERDIRNELTDKAQAQAIKVFSKNLRSLLLQPPVRGKVVLGLDPGYRTGCKWSVIDKTGKFLEAGVIYPTAPLKKIKESEEALAGLVEKYGVNAIVIGNGTASRETEVFVADFIKSCNKPGLSYTIVSEAGASVYSASKLAKKEFPGLDVSERGAVSIARRIQDPLAELVKIEPRAVGVGQYQHDLPPKHLDEKLAEVVESVVNYVGVDLNTASAQLLGYVAGIKATVAENIVHYRDEIGGFKRRKELSKVPRLGPKTLEQCVGFLRINNGDDRLDATAIHPESYDLTHRFLDLIGSGVDEIGRSSIRSKIAGVDVEEIAAQLDAGVPTLKDIVDCLARPGRDPREDLPVPVFRTDVLSIEDLKPGMELTGTVRNVVDFGAFVDIGIKNDGLVHVSEMSDTRVRHPMDLVSVGDVVKVYVLSIDMERGRVALSMKTRL